MNQEMLPSTRMRVSSRRFDTADIICRADMFGFINQTYFLEKLSHLAYLISSDSIKISTEDSRSLVFDRLDNMLDFFFSRFMMKKISTEMTVDKLIYLIRYMTCPDEKAMSLSSIFVYMIEKFSFRESNLDTRQTRKP